MNPKTALTLLLLFLAIFSKQSASAAEHFIFFNQDRDGIKAKAFLDCSAIVGAQIKYTWRRLEPTEGKYNFDFIREDLAFLGQHHKKLIVQLQDSSFSDEIVNVPDYLRKDPRFHGGANRQYDFQGQGEEKATPAGWVARRWDPAVRERFASLLQALAAEFDGKIEAVVLPETAVEFGETSKWYPQGFTPALYRDGVIANMKAMKSAFKKSHCIQYANFMPGEWLPSDDHGFLKSVYQSAVDLGVGVGGPDLLPFRKGQLDHSYPLIRNCVGKIPTAIAVQEGNYGQKDPETKQPITVAQLDEFAENNLKVDYIFWSTEEPYYTKDVLPFLKKAVPAHRQ